MLSEHEIVVFCILRKTSFALTPTRFFIVTEFKFDWPPSYHINDDNYNTSRRYTLGIASSTRTAEYRTWLSSPHSSFRYPPPTDNSFQLPRLSFLLVQKPWIHSVSLNAGMVSVNRNIAWIGLRIRCLAHSLRCYWRVPWGNRVYQFKVNIFRRKVSSTRHCVGWSS